MIELGYMAKRIRSGSDWVDAPHVRDIYAVADCISQAFCDYIECWKHNGFWFFDSPELIQSVAIERGVDLTETVLLYYQGYPRQFDADGNAWTEYRADPRLLTAVSPPPSGRLLGYDVVTFSVGVAPECSPLSCNNVAADVQVNEHCLLDSLDVAIDHLKQGVFNNSEHGPFRIIAVNAVEWSNMR